MLLEEKMKTTPLSPSEKNITKYIIEHKYQLKQLSTRAIAKETYTSSAAVIRLAHKLGFSGYNQMREEYLDELQYEQAHFQDIDANIPFQSTDSIMDISAIMQQVMIESARDTFSLIEHDELQNIIRVIKKATNIYIYGISSHILIAKNFKLKMARIGKNVIVEELLGELTHQTNVVQSQDCAIIISYSGETLSLMQVVERLKQKEVPLIAITSIGENSLKLAANYTLHISTREKLHSKIANYTSEYSVELILNILYSCFFSLKYQTNLENKIKTAKTIEQNRFSSSKIINE